MGDVGSLLSLPPLNMKVKLAPTSSSENTNRVEN